MKVENVHITNRNQQCSIRVSPPTYVLVTCQRPVRPRRLRNSSGTVYRSIGTLRIPVSRMLLTLYFMAAAWIQSWRLQSVCTHLSRFVAQRATIAFYATASAPVNDIGVGDLATSSCDLNAASANKEDASGGSSQIGDDDDVADSKRITATSDLCTNAALARIVDVIWSGTNVADRRRQGVALTPKQQLRLGPWIEFPPAPSMVPINVQVSAEFQRARGEQQLLHVLLETQTEPVRQRENNVLRIEDFGRPVAWKLDSRLAVLLETDLAGLAALVTRTFMQNNLVVNDYLPLVRIETVDTSGEPQPFRDIRQHSRAELFSRKAAMLTSGQWQRHVEHMRELNILASQASEFVYNRMRTEGKTGLSKSDQQPSKATTTTTMAGTLAENVNAVAVSSPVAAPRRLSNDASNASVVGDQDRSQMRRPSARISPRTSPLRLIPECGEETAVRKSTVNADNAKIASTIPSTTLSPPKSEEPPTPIAIVQPAVPQKFATPTKPSADVAPKPSVAPKTVTLEATPIAAAADKSPTAASPRQSSGAARPTLVRSKGSLLAAKPPNVLVYSESAATRDAVIQTLAALLASDVYTVYPLTAAEVRHQVWIDNTTMLVVCGSVAADVGAQLTEFFLRGGRMLSLCSDVLHIVLPAFRTHAEVREHELVQFSYGRWQSVRMMHHIFCYQPSPVRKHFSTDSEEASATTSAGGSGSASRNPSSLVCPRSVEVDDLQQQTHSLQVQVLGTEETWNTPSLILATNGASGGKAVFSQVHLEADPISFEHDDAKYPVLRQSNAARMEIFSDLLSKHLDISVRSIDERNAAAKAAKYSCAYFLGDFRAKFELLERLGANMSENKTMKLPQLTLRFCGHREQPPAASESLLPIMINSCPEDFSTIDYFENLKSITIGRLAIYAPVLTSTTHLFGGVPLAHGLAVIARQQTAGSGRSKNQWLSPDGCLMFSLQLNVPLASPLGQRLSLLQHLVAVAVVNAILTLDGYEDLNIRLKWPNDIYANGRTKIGGLIVASQVDSNRAVCTIGCGVNLSNSSPTVCINDLIRQHNSQLSAADRRKPLAELGYERLLALVFTELERLFVAVQDGGDLQQLYELYDRLWLHSDAEVSIVDAAGDRRTARVIGIDEYGFLLVKRDGAPDAETVHPDGNSFDMLRGLIVPKTN